MEIERIEQLIAKSSLTIDEKREIREAADSEGIKYTIKKGKFCGSCYEKILVKLYEAKRKDVTANVSRDGYRLRDVFRNTIIGGKIVNNTTIRDIEVGVFSESVRNKFFEKCE